MAGPISVHVVKGGGGTDTLNSYAGARSPKLNTSEPGLMIFIIGSICGIYSYREGGA